MLISDRINKYSTREHLISAHGRRTQNHHVKFSSNQANKSKSTTMASKHLNNNNKDNQLKPQLVSILVFASILTHLLPLAVSAGSAGSSSQQGANSEATSSSQPLWSYQVKPNGYGGLLGNGGAAGGQSNGGGQSAHYTGGAPSLFDAFSGLSQRQGALSGSPLMSILPIILIAAGGLLLLLPMFTMMLASPFGGLGGQFGGAGGGYQNFGYPQMARKRSLDSPLGQRQGIIELIEHISTTIEELGKKYTTNNQPANGGGQINNSQAQQHQQPNKRAKSMNSQPQQQANDLSQAPANINQQQQQQHQATPVNHKPLEEAILASGSNNNIPVNL